MDARVPPEERSSWLSAQVLAEATGEQPEMVVRSIWPTAGLAARIDEWLDEYQPDLVFVAVNAFWFTYASVPLRMKRVLGRPGEAISGVGRRMAANPKFSERRLFHVTRRWLLRTVGGDMHFTPEHVLEVVEASLRRIVAREDVVVVVRGPLASHGVDIGGRTQRRSDAAWRRVDRRLRDLCASLHVEYGGIESPADTRGSLSSADMVHPDADGHRYRAEMEGSLMVRGWARAHGAEPARSRLRPESRH